MREENPINSDGKAFNGNYWALLPGFAIGVFVVGYAIILGIQGLIEAVFL